MNNQSKQKPDKKIAELEKKLSSKNRELEIEAALERVRTKSMAMHRSDELKEVADSLLHQLKDLKVRLDSVHILFFKENSKDYESWTSNGFQGLQPYSSRFLIPYRNNSIINEIHKAKRKGLDSFSKDSLPAEKNNFFKYLFEDTDYIQLSDEIKKRIKNYQKYIFSIAFVDNVGLQMNRYSGEVFSENEIDILKRFVRVFHQAYTRFLDLQKAEAQAREAQVEAALERVRARSMGMHKSEELVEVVRILDKEINGLGVEVNGTQIVTDFANQEEGSNDWFAREGQDYLEKFHVPYIEHPITKRFYNALHKGVDFYTDNYSKAEKNKYFRQLFKYSDFRKTTKERQEFIYNSPAIIRAVVVSKNSVLVFQRFDLKEFTKEEEGIFKRFGKVFDQAYTRFLDLQKAEAQAREAQIEAALERVRARSMGMHKSKELKDVVRLLYKEFRILVTDTHSVNIQLKLDSSKDIYYWASVEEDIYQELYHLQDTGFPILEKIHNAFNSPGDGFLDYLLTKEEKDAFFSGIFKIQPVPPHRKKMIQNAEGMVVMGWFHKNSGIDIMRYNLNRFSDEEKDIVKRFAATFEQTYIRFLDLQKAEAQAREAQIEAALERVRSHSLAMHDSEDLHGVVTLVYEQLESIGLFMNSVLLHELTYDSKSQHFWVAANGQVYPEQTEIPISKNAFFSRFRVAKENNESFFVQRLSKQQKDNFFKHYFGQSSHSDVPQDRKDYIFSCDGLNRSTALHEYTALTILRYDKIAYSPEQNEVIRRFAQVFEQSYRRYLDLKKAEEQAREAEIQLALERVRARTMAMYNSDELAETAAILFQQMTALGVTPERLNICLINEAGKILEVWATDQEGTKISHHFNASLDEPTTGKRVYDAWKEKKKSIVIDLSGKELNDWIRYVRQVMGMTIKDELVREHRIHSVAFFSQGLILTTTSEPLPGESIKLLERFADVFNLTYRRFLDLQKAEAQAREAIKQASLDRVRGEIASMRNSEDLNRITPVIWRELKALEVPFIRCGVFIIDETNESVGVFLTTPDGKALGVLHLAFDANKLTSNTVESWRKKEVYKDHWNKEEFINWTKSMMKLGQVQNAETYQGSSQPPESLHLHFVPFAQGMLYVGNTSPLDEEKLELVKTLAEAFSIAYARYEDFKNLEEAKARVDHTLNELQSTQKQLIQSEKMASLGELTAGIAHEIQNPLNFVNNFSEVNKELVDELKSELATGNLQLANEIADDIKSNEEKISHHGKRADAIVKSMLEHSRTSTGIKEPTDINKLADEYLRLSYHGLRAKNKSFNAEMKTDFDSSIKKINIIAQDIGRVMLNLFNNAFYACAERSRSTVNQQKEENSILYKPTVSVSTKKEGDRVTITVKDNGGGIPEEVKEKIFQPFFTTKPTGQGTGLGLSLSYDIVKAHGGEIKVNTKEDEGTKFILVLPS